jgi:hypothetical protein
VAGGCAAGARRRMRQAWHVQRRQRRKDRRFAAADRVKATRETGENRQAETCERGAAGGRIAWVEESQRRIEFPSIRLTQDKRLSPTKRGLCGVPGTVREAPRCGRHAA